MDMENTDPEILELKIENEELLIPSESSLNRITKSTGFALAEYSQEFTLNQSKIFHFTLSQIQADEDPNNTTPYTIDIHELAREMGGNIKSNALSLRRAFKNMPNPELYFEYRHEWIKVPLYAIRQSHKENHYLYDIQFSPMMRKIFIDMKKHYTLIYKSETVAKFSTKYTPFLYDYLLSRISVLEPQGRYYKITVTPEQLMVRLNFKSTIKSGKVIGAFNSRVVLPASRDVSAVTELMIKDDEPVVERGGANGRQIINYIFMVGFKPNSQIPLATYDNDYEAPRIYLEGQVPGDDYLTTVLKVMGVQDSFIKSCINDETPMRVWAAILYTKIYGENSPSYFNAAYTKEYAKDRDIVDMLSVLNINDTNFKNPIAVGNTYISREEKKMLAKKREMEHKILRPIRSRKVLQKPVASELNPEVHPENWAPEYKKIYKRIQKRFKAETEE